MSWISDGFIWTLAADPSTSIEYIRTDLGLLIECLPPPAVSSLVSLKIRLLPPSQRRPPPAWPRLATAPSGAAHLRWQPSRRGSLRLPLWHGSPPVMVPPPCPLHQVRSSGLSRQRRGGTPIPSASVLFARQKTRCGGRGGYAFMAALLTPIHRL